MSARWGHPSDPTARLTRLTPGLHLTAGLHTGLTHLTPPAESAHSGNMTTNPNPNRPRTVAEYQMAAGILPDARTATVLGIDLGHTDPERVTVAALDTDGCPWVFCFYSDCGLDTAYRPDGPPLSAYDPMGDAPTGIPVALWTVVMAALEV